MKYTVDYFIQKFEAIPEYRWCEVDLQMEDGVGCALGHCGMVDYFGNPEANALNELFIPIYKKRFPATTFCLYEAVYIINDGNEIYPHPTPKQRILAALRDIKKMQEPQHTDITKSLAVLPPQETPDVKQINQLS